MRTAVKNRTAKISIYKQRCTLGNIDTKITTSSNINKIN